MLACTQPKRLLQNAFGHCEWFMHGAVAAGAIPLVYHCDKVGDIADQMDHWEVGAGDMFAEQKHYTDA